MAKRRAQRDASGGRPTETANASPSSIPVSGVEVGAVGPSGRVFRCPGCPLEWATEIYGHDQAFALWKSHTFRHAHARPEENHGPATYARHGE